jgi:hypothetical protein
MDSSCHPLSAITTTAEIADEDEIIDIYLYFWSKKVYTNTNSGQHEYNTFILNEVVS